MTAFQHMTGVSPVEVALQAGNGNRRRYSTEERRRGPQLSSSCSPMKTTNELISKLHILHKNGLGIYESI